MEGEEARLLSPLTAVEFQAVPFRKKDSAAFFMVIPSFGLEFIRSSKFALFLMFFVPTLSNFSILNNREFCLFLIGGNLAVSKAF